jgi:hypothetical protein
MSKATILITFVVASGAAALLATELTPRALKAAAAVISSKPPPVD